MVQLPLFWFTQALLKALKKAVRGPIKRSRAPSEMLEKARENGYDPDNELHLVLTTYESVMPLLLEGPWSHVVALERWQGGRFYSTVTWSGDEGPAAQGHVKRTPAHAASWVTGIGDQYKPDKDGNPHVTSLVFDLIK